MTYFGYVISEYGSMLLSLMISFKASVAVYILGKGKILLIGEWKAVEGWRESELCVVCKLY